MYLWGNGKVLEEHARSKTLLRPLSRHNLLHPLLMHLLLMFLELPWSLVHEFYSGSLMLPRGSLVFQPHSYVCAHLGVGKTFLGLFFPMLENAVGLQASSAWSDPVALAACWM